VHRHALQRVVLGKILDELGREVGVQCDPDNLPIIPELDQLDGKCGRIAEPIGHHGSHRRLGFLTIHIQERVSKRDRDAVESALRHELFEIALLGRPRPETTRRQRREIVVENRRDRVGIPVGDPVGPSMERVHDLIVIGERMAGNGVYRHHDEGQHGRSQCRGNRMTSHLFPPSGEDPPVAVVADE
jgi:hypothetical protein